MDGDEPGGGEVDEVVEHVGVGDAVDGGVDGDEEVEDAGEVAETGCYARDHLAAGQGFDEQDEGHDGEDVVVGGEGGEPVDGEVVDPDDENGEVDGEDPEHEDED